MQMLTIAKDKLDALENSCVDASNMPLRGALAFRAQNGHTVVLNRFSHWANRGRSPLNSSEVFDISKAMPLPFCAEQMEAYHNLAGTPHLSEDPQRWKAQFQEMMTVPPPPDAITKKVTVDRARNCFEVDGEVLRAVLKLADRGETTDFTLVVGGVELKAEAKPESSARFSRTYTISGEWLSNDFLLELLTGNPWDRVTVVLSKANKRVKTSTNRRVAMELYIKPTMDYIETVQEALEVVAKDLACGAVKMAPTGQLLGEILDAMSPVSLDHFFMHTAVRLLCLVPESFAEPHGEAHGTTPQRQLMDWCLCRYGHHLLEFCMSYLCGEAGGFVGVDQNLARCPFHAIDRYFASKRLTPAFENALSHKDACLYLPHTFLTYFPFTNTATPRSTVIASMVRCFRSYDDDCACVSCCLKCRFQSVVLSHTYTLKCFLYLFFSLATITDLACIRGTPHPPELKAIFRFILDHHAHINEFNPAEPLIYGPFNAARTNWHALFAKLWIEQTILVD